MSKLTQDEILVLKMINKAENNQKYEGTDFKTEKDKISNWEDLIKSLIQKGYLNGEIIVGKGGGEVINLGKKQLTEKAENFLNKKETIAMKILCFAVIFFFLFPVFVVMTQKNDINNTSNTIKTNSDKQQKATVASAINTNEIVDNFAQKIDKVHVVSKKYGYTRFGEEAVVGEVKNDNDVSVEARVDIKLLDKNNNVVGDTYTYDTILPNSTWYFEAPIFGKKGAVIDVLLTVEE